MGDQPFTEQSGILFTDRIDQAFVFLHMMLEITVSGRQIMHVAEEEQIGYPITMVSNGPGREDIIYRKSKYSK